MNENGFRGFLTKIRKGLSPYWQSFKKRLKQVWHRFQLTRVILATLLAIILVGSAVLTYEAKTADVENLKAALEQPTAVYDKEGKKAGTLLSQKGTYVGLDKISPNIQNAVISTEDRNFYHEYGFSVKGIARAFYLYGKNKLLGRNYISGGGSTLTQQLTKNAFLSQEQTITRKAKELFLSIEVENVYTKKDILSMYLNNAYFGNGVWGVQDASEKYFGKSASELTVPEAATLAGSLRNPSAYNPIDHPQASRDRRNLVLKLMNENKVLSSAEVTKYSATSMNISDNYNYQSSYRYPYYFDAVINEAISKYGLTESEIMNRGYKIYTDLDQNYQKQMQTQFKNSTLFPANASDGTKVQAASIALDPADGGVMAVVGGRGKHVFRGYNRATQMRRQPGSAMKPLAVYTPALQNGYFYDSELSDKKQSFGSNNYSPKNYNNVYQNKVPMYEALAQSMNVPAVWLLNKIGVNKGYESVKNFGIPITKSDKNLALALGGLSTGVSPQQLAAAYTAFANGGQVTQAHYITKIVDASGNVIVDSPKVSNKRIMTKKVAKEMTSMMMGVFNSGSGVSAKPYGYTIAGKTGSTEADGTGDSDATKDKWIVGYTPDIVVTTWEGFDNTSKSQHLENLSATGVGPLFRNEMQSILPYTANTAFNTKDAATIAKGESGGSSSSIWDSVAKGASDFSDKVTKGASGAAQAAKDLWDQAKSVLGQ